MLAIGYIAAPVLFSQVADRALAGNVAGAMFGICAWISLACGAYLATFILSRKGARALASGVFWIVIAMIGLALAGHWGVQPILAEIKQDALPKQVMESVLHDRFSAWHGVSSALFLIQSVLGIWLVCWQERGRSHG